MCDYIICLFLCKVSQLASKDSTVCYQALGTLIDEMIDPEKCYRAIEKFAIAKQLAKLLVRIGMEKSFKINGKPNTMAQQRVLIVLHTIASHESGAAKILFEAKLVKEMNNFLRRVSCIQDVAKVWSQMASNYTSMYHMYNHW